MERGETLDKRIQKWFSEEIISQAYSQSPDRRSCVLLKVMQGKARTKRQFEFPATIFPYRVL